MTKQSHTPGPWKQRVLMVVAANGRDTICHCGGQLHPVAPRADEAVGNARLIALAPEMADFLQRLELHMQGKTPAKGRAHAEEGKRLRAEQQAILAKLDGAQ